MAHCNYCRSGLQKFSDDTTMHGFLELYYSKSLVWKVIWLLAIVGAIGISVFQIYVLAKDIIESPTTTVIQPLSGPFQYPPMRFCYVHWMYWVDWNRTVELGFDKFSVLYSLGFFSIIISESDFNITEASINLNRSMEQNKFAHLMEFYDAISFHNPPGITLENISWKYWQKMFDHRQQYCYVATNEMITNALTELNSNEIKIMYDKNYHNFDSPFITMSEYRQLFNEDLIKFMEPSSIHLNDTFEFFSGPPFANFDGVGEKTIAPAVNIFQIQISVTGEWFHWLNTTTQTCNSDKSLTDHYDNCKQFCYYFALHNKNPNSCMDILGAWMLGIDTTETVCKHGSKFLDSGNFTKGTFPENGYLGGNNSTDIFKQCTTKYCRIPCDNWQYSSVATSMQIPPQLQHLNMQHFFIVSYPQSGVLEMRQIESQTWISIIGNLGGIVGLWLGASILSILQMVYLLCFAPTEKNGRIKNVK